MTALKYLLGYPGRCRRDMLPGGRMALITGLLYAPFPPYSTRSQRTVTRLWPP